MDHKPKWSCKTVKPLEDNIRENLDDFGCCAGFLDTIPMNNPWKERIGKLDFIKIKNFFSVKTLLS